MHLCFLIDRDLKHQTLYLIALKLDAHFPMRAVLSGRWERDSVRL